MKKTRLFLNVIEIDVLEKVLFGLEKCRSIYSMNVIRNIKLSKTVRKRRQLDGRRLDSVQYECQCQYIFYKSIFTIEARFFRVINIFSEK